jgi:hypothetical protein
MRLGLIANCQVEPLGYFLSMCPNIRGVIELPLHLLNNENGRASIQRFRESIDHIDLCLAYRTRGGAPAVSVEFSAEALALSCRNMTVRSIS